MKRRRNRLLLAALGGDRRKTACHRNWCARHYLPTKPRPTGSRRREELIDCVTDLKPYSTLRVTAFIMRNRRSWSKVLLQKWLLLAVLAGSNSVSICALNDTRPFAQTSLNICVAMIRPFAYPAECGANNTATGAGCDGIGCLEEPCRSDRVQLSLEEFSRAYDGFDIDIILGVQT